MAVRSYQTLGIELAPYVLDWGGTEQVKDVLLAQAQLFTSEHTLVLANTDNRFSQSNTKSPFYGRSIELAPVTLAIDGVNVYTGFIRAISLDHAARTASIITENAFTMPANSNVILTANGLNPAAAIQTILVNAGLGAYIDPVSFAAARSNFTAAGATINLNYVAGGNTTALAAIQAISSMCSVSCFVVNGLIKLQAWQPYQGNLSGVKYQIAAATTYAFGTLEEAYQSLSNSVTVLWGSSSLYLKNAASIALNGIETNTQLAGGTGGQIVIPNLSSATYFGQQFLARASTLRRQGRLNAGSSLIGVNIGDRVSIAAPNWSTSPLAFEVLEAKVNLNDLSVEMLCATL